MSESEDEKPQTMNDLVSLLRAWHDRGMHPGTMSGGLGSVAVALLQASGITALDAAQFMCEVVNAVYDPNRQAPEELTEVLSLLIPGTPVHGS